ncbi:MAG: NUDIX hydrolase [Spirochaetes bacterium]|nr:NUDIX hydrolase [Spirochaetota bacterium]
MFGKRVAVRVAGIIVRDGELLLVAHRKGRDVYWLLPGGGVEYGEALDRALRREFIEELGVEVDVCEPVLMCDSIDPEGKRHIVNIMFRCAYRSGDYALGRDRRLFDYGFFRGDELAGKRIYPPINDSLVAILANRSHDFYLGCLWLK